MPVATCWRPPLDPLDRTLARLPWAVRVEMWLLDRLIMRRG